MPDLLDLDRRFFFAISSSFAPYINDLEITFSSPSPSLFLDGGRTKLEREIENGSACDLN